MKIQPIRICGIHWKQCFEGNRRNDGRSKINKLSFHLSKLEKQKQIQRKQKKMEQ